VLALITPPVEMNLYVIRGVAGAPFSEVIRGVLPCALLILMGLVVVFTFPQLATWLQQVAGFGGGR
jgi:C4-dicarboxylate transporter DctM subunit